jgi:Domain of unknown function (DUF4340)
VSPKTLIRIGILLGVLLLAWGGLALVQRSREDHPRQIQLPHVKEDEVDRVVMAPPPPADSVILVKQGPGKWEIDSAPVSDAAIHSFFAALDDSTASSELVAQSSAVHERMGVDSAKAKRLTLFGGGKPLLQLWLGNHGPDFEGYFVRLPGQPEVYLYHGTFASLADQRATEWRDPVITKLPADSITGIEVTRGKQHWAVRKDGKQWVFSAGLKGPVDSAAMHNLLGQFAEVRAVSFPDRAQKDSARFDHPARRLTILGPGGGKVVDLVMDSTYGGFWVRSDSGGPIYKLDQSKANGMMPLDSTLRAQ